MTLIVKAESILLSIPFTTGGDPWMFGGIPWTNFDVMLIRIETSNGLVGWGEAFARNRDLPLKAVIDHHLLPKLLGLDAMRSAEIKDMLERQFHNFGRIGPEAFGISAIDIALWDIRGKKAGLPIAELLGGRRTDKIDVYASLMRYASKSRVAEACKRAVKDGYRHIKLHEVGLLENLIAREAAGDEVEIMLDVNCPWDEFEAIRMERALRSMRPRWLEEPIWPPENFSAMARVRERGETPIAAGEDAGSLYDFQQMFEHRAVDIAQPDLAKCFGITEAVRISALADAHNVKIIPHCAMFGPGLLATLHFNASRYDTPVLERLYVDLERNPISPALIPLDGKLSVPTGPGLGFDPDPEVIEAYKIHR